MLIVGIVNIALLLIAVFLFISSSTQIEQTEQTKRLKQSGLLIAVAVIIGLISYLSAHVASR